MTATRRGTRRSSAWPHAAAGWPHRKNRLPRALGGAGTRCEPSAFGSRHDGADRGRAKPSPRDGRRADRLRAAARLREQLRQTMPCTFSAAALPIPHGRLPARSASSPASANGGSPRNSSGRPARSWRSSGRNRCAATRRQRCCSTAGRLTPTRKTRPANGLRPRRRGRSQMGGRPAFG